MKVTKTRPPGSPPAVFLLRKRRASLILAFTAHLELARGWFLIEAKVCIMASIKAVASVAPLFEDGELSFDADELSFERGET